MYFSFNVENETLARITNSRKYLGKVQDILDTMLIVFNEETTASVYYTGNRTTAKFDFDILNFTHSEDKPDETGALPDLLPYFMVKTDTFMNVLEKAILLETSAKISVDIETNKITINVGATKYATTCYERVDEETVLEIMDSLNTVTKKPEFEKDTCSLSLDRELIDFYSSVASAMLLKTNAIAVDKNKLRYADNLTIIEYTCKNEITSSDNTEHITSSIYELARSLIAKDGNVQVLLSNSRNYAYVKNAELAFEGLFGIEDLLFDYPTEAELEQFYPTDEEKAEFTFTKNDLFTALNKFDGIFEPTLWKIKPIIFQKSLKDISDNNFNLSWSDYNAEIDSQLLFTNSSIASEVQTNGTEVKVTLPTVQLYKLLSLLDDEDTVTIRFGDIGCKPGVLVTTKSFSAVIAACDD